MSYFQRFQSHLFCLAAKTATTTPPPPHPSRTCPSEAALDETEELGLPEPLAAAQVLRVILVVVIVETEVGVAGGAVQDLYLVHHLFRVNQRRQGICHDLMKKNTEQNTNTFCYIYRNTNST